MLRMYCLQQWYALADEALEDFLYDSQKRKGQPGTWRGYAERAGKVPESVWLTGSPLGYRGAWEPPAHRICVRISSP